MLLTWIKEGAPLGKSDGRAFLRSGPPLMPSQCWESQPLAHPSTADPPTGP